MLRVVSTFEVTFTATFGCAYVLAENNLERYKYSNGRRFLGRTAIYPVTETGSFFRIPRRGAKSQGYKTPAWYRKFYYFMAAAT